MSERAERIASFLREAGWGGARCMPLAGDASARRYLRLHRSGKDTAVLMDADPARGQDVRPFLSVAETLADHGLSVPDILARDVDHGLLLLEDFGDAGFARMLRDEPDREVDLYRIAVDALLALRSLPPTFNAKAPTPRSLAEMISPVLQYYPIHEAASGGALVDALETVLTQVLGPGTCFSLRDCHAENLMYLGDRAGVRAVGLLDFQDAWPAHPAYDLVSLLQDARRDLSPGVEARMIAHYLAVSGVPGDAFRAAYAALGVQRNLRILGIFARLAVRDGKPAYLVNLPRVWDHVQRDLRHPALTPARDLVARLVPQPTSRMLRALAGNVPA